MEIFDSKPYCEAAIDMGKQYDADFSYKKEDVAIMDRILEERHEEYLNKELSDEKIGYLASCFGVYLGQVMLDCGLSQCGYSWTMDGTEPCLAKDDNSRMYPVTKAYKMIENGAEDSIKSFFDIGILIGSGKFNLGDKSASR